jgi:hypothetical protein
VSAAKSILTTPFAGFGYTLISAKALVGVFKDCAILQIDNETALIIPLSPL